MPRVQNFADYLRALILESRAHLFVTGQNQQQIKNDIMDDMSDIRESKKQSKLETAARIKAHRERWHRLIVGASSPAKPELAEEALRTIYELNKKQCPEIFWLQNPYEMVAVPPAVSFLLGCPQWQNLLSDLAIKKQFSRTTVSKRSFEEFWRKHKLGAMADGMQKQMSRSLSSPAKESRNQALTCIKEIMLELAFRRLGAESSRDCRSLQPVSKLKENLNTGAAFLNDGFNLATAEYIDWDLWHRRITIQRELAILAGLDSKEQLFMSVFASGWITPPSKHEFRALLRANASDFKEQAKYIKQDCLEEELLSRRLCAWFQSLPRSTAANSFPIAWLPHSIELLTFALACNLIKPTLFGELQDEIEAWAFLSHSAGACVFHKQLAFLCPKPKFLALDNINRPHSKSGPAAEWEGCKVYSWRGRAIPDMLISMKDKVTAKSIRKNRNIEQRRLMIEIYGEERFLQDSKAELVAADTFGELFRLNLDGDEPICMVKVKNSTAEPDGSFKSYFLRVPPATRTAKEAVAWSFNMKEADYKPLVET